MIERTLVIVKPDGVARSICGKIVTRFEDAGFKIVGLKMVFVDKKFAEKHYTEDLAKRRGAHVRKYMVEFLQKGPVLALCLEGIDAIASVRKITGDTEPAAASPGTIRGDFAHITINHANSAGRAIPNLIHASSNAEDAKQEIKLWFTDKELHTYKTVHDVFTIE